MAFSGAYVFDQDLLNARRLLRSLRELDNVGRGAGDAEGRQASLKVGQQLPRKVDNLSAADRVARYAMERRAGEPRGGAASWPP